MGLQIQQIMVFIADDFKFFIDQKRLNHGKYHVIEGMDTVFCVIP
jgi:ubiquinone biosynthesis protein Coq4